jgi:hypothetical protein
MTDGPRSTTPRNLNYAASGGYLAMSTDVSMLEEYLRSSDSQAKSLREAGGLVEATPASRRAGNQLVRVRKCFRNHARRIRHSKERPGAFTNATGFGALPGVPAMPGSQKSFREWLDFSLLPPTIEWRNIFPSASTAAGPMSTG